MTDTAPAPPSRHLPLLLLALCFALGVFTRGQMDTFSVFVPALQESFAAGRADITGIYGMALLGVGFGGPLAGWLFDRLGPMRVAVAGVVCAGCGLLLASQATALWHLHLAIGFLGGVATAALGGVFQSALLGRWFRARLGTALAVAWSANGVGVMLLAPVVEALIAARDWRFAWWCVGLAILALLVPVLLMPWRRIAAGEDGTGSRAGATSAEASGATIGSALRDGAFWGMTASFAFTSIGIFVINPQIAAYLVERGLPDATAAGAVAMTGLLMPVGMIGFSALADRGGRMFGVVAAYTGSILGVVALWFVRGPGDMAFLVAFVLLYGGTMGSRGPMISAMTALRYRGPYLGRIYGLMTCGTGAGGALGAWAGGHARDVAGGYDPVFAISVVGLILGALPLVIEARAREKATRTA